MKKLPEKQPVDDLFARKLANMSLPTSPNGFARLQARMGQGEPEIRVVFWRNPPVRRYIAVAACLLLVCLFGWLYQLAETPLLSKATVAAKKPAVSTQKKRFPGELNPAPETEVALTQPIPERRMPVSSDSERTVRFGKKQNEPIADQQKNDPHQLTRANQAKPATPNVPTGVAAQPTEQVAEVEAKEPSVEPTPGQHAAPAIDKPALVAERVLIVTIAEPEALSAARRVVTSTERGAAEPSEDAKGVNLWQRVKRIKQGEVFARKDPGEDERGLLSRAYSGLKQTFDKDKSAKQ